MKLTEQQIAIGMKLTASCRNYSAKMAEADLKKLTSGQYYLDGFTGQYIIQSVNKDQDNVDSRFYGYGDFTIIDQRRCKLTLRLLVITALDLYFTGVKEV